MNKIAKNSNNKKTKVSAWYDDIDKHTIILKKLLKMAIPLNKTMICSSLSQTCSMFAYDNFLANYS